MPNFVNKKILVVGNGGREHALGWALRKSGVKLYTAPGNAGTQKIGTNISIEVKDIPQLLRFAQKEKIYLTVVGPEAPLALGIVNEFQKNNLPIFGPTKEAARLETSKVWARQFIARHGLPQPEFATFGSYGAARDYLKSYNKPCVIKADGLAAGKGVIVCDTQKEAQVALRRIMIDKEFGSAGKAVVIEERLYGKEASVLAFADGKTVVPLPPAEDYKQVFDGDLGSNTGGMGGVCPHWEVVNPQELEGITKEILYPTVIGLAAEGKPYQGILYAGLMKTKSGFRVLEFNCRGGDPETQIILPLLETPLLPALLAVVKGKLDKVSLRWKKKFCVGVVLASEDYPEKPAVGREVLGVKQVSKKRGVLIFEAGTKWDERKRVSSGGRVLLVAGLGLATKQAADLSYGQIATPGEMKSGKIPRGKIGFLGAHYRSDIAQRGRPRYR